MSINPTFRRLAVQGSKVFINRTSLRVAVALNTHTLVSMEDSVPPSNSISASQVNSKVIPVQNICAHALCSEPSFLYIYIYYIILYYIYIYIYYIIYYIYISLSLSLHRHPGGPVCIYSIYLLVVLVSAQPPKLTDRLTATK